MSRLLIPGLVAEGKTDELFLGRLITRQLRALTDASAHCIDDVEPIQVGDRASILDEERVARAVCDLAADCHIVFVHNDHRERHKAMRIVARVKTERKDTPTVPIVPVRETEAWLLADRGLWTGLKGACTTMLPETPHDIEKTFDPKVVLERVRPRHVKDLRELFGYVGRTIDLGELSRIPAHRTWVAETTKVLKELRYL